MKYRKRPVVIDAFQWLTHLTHHDLPEWALKGDIQMLPGDCANLWIMTLEGRMQCPPGWWIIRGVKGELYPCHPDIFAATYDPA